DAGAPADGVFAAAAACAEPAASSATSASRATARIGACGALRSGRRRRGGMPRPSELDDAAFLHGGAGAVVREQPVEVDAIGRRAPLRVPAVPADLVIARVQLTLGALEDQAT